MNERIKVVINYLRLINKIDNALDFGQKLGVTKQRVYEWTSGRVPVSAQKCAKISEVFPEINGMWIRAGEGEMLRTTAAASILNAATIQQVTGGKVSHMVAGDNTINNNSAMNERLITVIDYLRLTKKVANRTDFAQRLGIGKSTLGQLTSGKVPVSVQKCVLISQLFPEINGMWIRTGEGEMLRTPTAAPILSAATIQQVTGGKVSHMVAGDNTINNNSALADDLRRQLRDRDKLLRERDAELASVRAQLSDAHSQISRLIAVLSGQQSMLNHLTGDAQTDTAAAALLAPNSGGRTEPEQINLADTATQSHNADLNQLTVTNPDPSNHIDTLKK